MRLLALLLIPLLAGCTSLTNLKSDVSEKLFGREQTDPPMALSEIAAKADARVLWSAKVGDAGGYDFTPAVDGGSVFAAAATGEIVRIDAASGKPAWRVNAGEPLTGGVGAGENLVLVGTAHGMVLAYDQGGRPLWKAKVSSEVLSAPKVAGGVVVVRSGDSRIYGIDARDGKRRWVYERSTPSLTLRTSAGVVLAGGVAYVGFAGGKLVALNVEDGKVRWEVSVAFPKGVTEIERIADITSLPAVEEGTAYAVAYQGRAAGVDIASGKIKWTRDISSFTGIDVQRGRLFLSHSGGAVYALDVENGRSYWRQGGLLNRKLSAPLALGALVAVGDLEGYVHFLSRENGAFMARVRTQESPVMPQMASLGEQGLVLQTHDGGLYAIAVK